MIPSLEEIVRSLYGAYRLARLDPSGMRFFNASIEGFWRSFFAAVLVAPFYALLLAIGRATLAPAADPVRFALAEAIGYVNAWLAFPVAMAWLSERLNRRDRYIPYIVAYNWAAVLQNAVFISVALLSVTGAIPEDAAFFLWLMALAAILSYVWFIARVGLALNPLAAAGIVAVDISLNILISQIADSLY